PAGGPGSGGGRWPGESEARAPSPRVPGPSGGDLPHPRAAPGGAGTVGAGGGPGWGGAAGRADPPPPGYQAGRVAEASEALRKAGNSPLAQAAEEGADQEAIAARLHELYQRLDREGEEPGLLLELRRLRIAQGRLREAQDLFSRAVALAPDRAEANYELGMAAYLALEYDRAVVAFIRALEADPTLAAAHTGL